MVERDVRDHGHAAVPGVSRVEPSAQPDLDDRQIDAGLGKPEERHRRQQLELGRFAVAPGDPIGQGENLAGDAGERLRIDRHAADLQPLAIGHEVWLGRLTDAVLGGPSADPTSARTLPLPLVPAISTPRNERSG